MKLHCKRCQKEVELELSESGPHIKASCLYCGAYIKFISERELKGETMSEFEIVFRLEGNEYGDCVILQKYGDNYKLVSGFISNRTDQPIMRWAFPQDKDKKPRDKALPVQINLGNLKSARVILEQALEALPIAPGERQSVVKTKDDDDCPF